MSGPDPAEYQGQSTAAQSANGKATLLKHSPTCSSALATCKRSVAEPIAPGSTLSSRSSHSMCEALPGTPTRADLMTPAKGMGGSHTSTSSQQGWSSATSTSAGSGYPFTSSPFAVSQPLTCKFTVGPSAKLQPRLTRLAVPSLMDTDSTGSLGLACYNTPATSAASNGSQTPAAVAHNTKEVPSPAQMSASAQCPGPDIRQAPAHATPSPRSPACLVRPARRSSGISSISSRPEWSSAYSCTSAKHPSPMQRSTPCLSKQPTTPVSTAGTHSPAPAATATRFSRFSPTAAAVLSHEAIRVPAGRSSSLAARLASTARTAPVSRAEADDRIAAATADEPSSTGLGATRPAAAAAAAPADPTHDSSTGRSRAKSSKPTRIQPAARATAKSSVAAERKTAEPRRSGRQGSICTKPAPQTTAQPPADVNIASRPDDVQLRRSARQSNILVRSAVCPTAAPPAAHATAPAAAASLRATAATAEPDTRQLRRSARQSSHPPRPSTRASAGVTTSAKQGHEQTAGPASQGNLSAGRRPNTTKTGQPSQPARGDRKSTRSGADITAPPVAVTTFAKAKVAAEPEHTQLRRSARQSMKVTRLASKANAKGHTCEPASKKVTESKKISSTQGQARPGVPAAKTVASASSTAQPARAKAAFCKAAMSAAVGPPARTAARAARRALAPRQAS